jgi:dipeptidyl-peptidase 4
MRMRRSAGHDMRRAFALFACAIVTTGAAQDLTIERLFEGPALSGAPVSGIRVSPDNARVTYLRGKERDKDRLDLWEYDIASRTSRLLLDSDSLATPDAGPSAGERSRRERQRTAAQSGIQDYFVAPDGRSLLVPQDGRLFYLDRRTSESSAAADLTAGKGPLTDAALSPRGAYAAYVRDQNLYVFALHERTEKPLTHDGGGAVSNGSAEYIAQEEMARFRGFWWSPDERHIAFERVDESPVSLRQRFEISDDDVTTFAQRYPAAGEANARISVGVADVASGAVRWIDLGSDPDIYLARVQWLPDGRTLAIQRESRDQRRLDLLFADIATGQSRIILTETSPRWIDLNDELTFLRHSGEFLWGSNRDGFQHLYLYSTDGRLLRQLTAGEWSVVDFRGRAIRAVDEKHRLVYFMANERSPMTRDLYVTSLDTSHPAQVRRLTREPGVHEITMSPGLSFYVDRFASSTQPPQVSLRRRDGSLLSYVEQNALDDRHPDAPYAAGNSLPEFGTLQAADGQTLMYRLFRPRIFDPARRYPAVISVYGGPGAQSVLDDWNGDSFVQILTRAGFVVFQLDNRGSAFRGTAFQAPLSGQLGGAEVEDQIRGARWLGSQPFIDKSRIGVWGWSYGGYMALMLLFRAPDVFRAGVAGAPVTDWTLYDTHYTERYLGRPQDHPAAYAASSVLGYAAGLQGRLLLLHGMADDNVLFSHSTKLMRALQDLGKPFDVMVYPGAKHGLMRQEEGRHAYHTILRFLNGSLQQ